MGLKMTENKDRINSILTNETHALSHSNFPLSSKYDPDFVFENNMGPHVLWLTEWLTREMQITPNMRILDLGCGKAISSIFLAYEYGVEVWANDLWIEATENWQRICDVGLEDRIFPIKAEAHALPYAENFFDCIISIDSYQYYGTDQLYLGYLHKFLKPGGEIGIVVPGLHREFPGAIPEHLTRIQKSGGKFWAWDCCVFHSAPWWRELWSQYAFIDLRLCEAMADGGDIWLEWEKALAAFPGEKMFPSDVEVFEEDQNQNVTFVRMIAQKKEIEH
jgi:ubiquinone/menaquinone biosynthesis C-methylase UbiE